MSETKDFVTIQTKLLNQAKELASNPWHSWRLWIHLVIQFLLYQQVVLSFLTQMCQTKRAQLHPKIFRKTVLSWVTEDNCNFIPKSSKLLYQLVALYFLTHMCQTKQVQLYPKIFRKNCIVVGQRRLYPKKFKLSPKIFRVCISVGRIVRHVSD